MITPGVTLLQRAPFLPGESLRSLLVRLRDMNLLTERSANQLFFPGQWRPDAVAPWQPTVLEHLGQIMGIAIAQVLQATPHRFYPILAPIRYRHEQHCDGGWYKHWAQPHHAWFCPTCLQEEQYHRLLWDMAWSGCCLDHECYLVDLCATCATPSTVSSVIQNICEHCHHAYTDDAPVPCLPTTAAFQVQWLVTHWMERPIPSRKTQTWGLPDWGVHTLMVALRLLVQHLQHHQPLPHGPQPTAMSAVVAQQWAEAMHALTQWPQHLDAFVDRWCPQPTSFQYSLDDIAPLYHALDTHASDEAQFAPFLHCLEASLLRRDRIQHVVVRYYLEEDPGFARRYQHAQQVALAQHYHTTLPVIAGLQLLGIIPEQLPLMEARMIGNPQATPYLSWCVRREDEEFALQCLNGDVTVDQIAQWLHLSRECLAAWLQLPRLATVTVTPATVRDMVLPVLAKCYWAGPTTPATATDEITIAEVADLLQWHGLTLAAWMRAVWWAELRCTQSSYTLDLATYRASRTQVLHYISRCCVQYLGIPVDELATHLRVFPDVASVLCQSPLFLPTMTVRDTQHCWQVIPQVRIASFQQTMLFGRAIIREWKMTEARLHRLLERHDLIPIWHTPTISPRFWVYRRVDVVGGEHTGLLVPRSSYLDDPAHGESQELWLPMRNNFGTLQ